MNDLLIASEGPQKIIQDLKDKFKLKIKGDGPLEYHLGCDYKLDKDGTLVAQPTRYFNKIFESYKKMFPDENFNAKSPLEKNDHPELDNSELCNEEQITKYMCMIVQLQWAITLGRYDILAQVMSMSRFRLAPKVGDLERMKTLYRYLAITKHFAIRYRTKELSTLTYQSKNMNGPGLFMEMSKKKYQRYTQTIRKEGNYHHIPGCQPTP